MRQADIFVDLVDQLLGIGDGELTRRQPDHSVREDATHLLLDGLLHLVFPLLDLCEHDQR